MLVDEAVVQRMKEKAILQYNPDLKILVKLQDSMNKALNDIGLKNSERLQLYNTRWRQMDKLLDVSGIHQRGIGEAVTQSSIDVPEREPKAVFHNAEPISEFAGAAVEPEHTFTGGPQIPKQFARKFGNVMDIINNHPSHLSESENGELVLNGAIQPGTSFDDIMRGLYVNLATEPKGTTRMVTVLANLGLPSGTQRCTRDNT